MLAKEKEMFKNDCSQKSGAWGNPGAVEGNRTFLGDGEGQRVIRGGEEGTTVMDNEDEDIVLLIILQTEELGTPFL